MDRNDERKDRTDEVADAEPARQGDILGLGGGAVPKSPADPSTEFDEQSVAQRRARARAGEEAGTTTENPNRQGGATGVDMGAGGQGTFIKGE